MQADGPAGFDGLYQWPSCDGGIRVAAIMSLLETAKLNGIDPKAYLRHVLDVIADHPADRVAELLPWQVTGIANRLKQD